MTFLNEKTLWMGIEILAKFVQLYLKDNYTESGLKTQNGLKTEDLKRALELKRTAVIINEIINEIRFYAK